MLQFSGVGRVTPIFNTQNTEDNPLGNILLSDHHYIAHPVSSEGQRHGYMLDVDYNLTAFDDVNLPNISTARMIRLLKNNNPLISQSLLNFRQFITYGYKLEGTPRARRNIEKIIDMLAKRRKPLPLLIGQIAEGIYVGGGAYTEIVLAKNRMDTIDLVVNDPLTAKFQVVKDPDYGEEFHLVKVDRRGIITSLENDITIKYLPVNGDINSPFGKPFMLSAIFPAVWQLLLLKDIRDVVRSQVYPFVHVKIDLEKILTAAGGDEDAATSDANKSKRTAIEAWANKGNNTAIATGDEVTYEIISGMNRANLGMVDSIIDILNGLVSSGTSTMPLFLGINDALDDGNADVQWLIQIAIIRSVQREINSLMTDNFNLINQAAGIGGEVFFTLITMNAMERLREAKIFEQEEKALIALIDHLTEAFALKTISMEDMIETYKQRKAIIYGETLD